LTNLIKSITTVIENYTWWDLYRKTWVAYFSTENFYYAQSKLCLDKCPIFSVTDITAIEYLDVTNTWVAFDKGTLNPTAGIYDNVDIELVNNKGATIFFKQPIAYSNELEYSPIRITFKTGYDLTVTGTVIPPEIIIALKNIVMFHYVNRGDYEVNEQLNGFPVPIGTKMLLDAYCQQQITLGGDYY
jgi:hypothetical protein